MPLSPAANRTPGPQLNDEVELLPLVRVLVVIVERGVKCDERILRADVLVVVDLPVGLANLCGRRVGVDQWELI